jgi:DNA-binding CsgD family transcriptional regulator
VLDTLLDPSHPEGEAGEPTVVSTDSLTQREGEILTLIGQGHSTQQISQLLMLSRHTVQTHRKNIMRKLGLQTTARLIRFAVTFGRGKS